MMKQNLRPTVSIVINNYNYASFLRDCIQSALGQTYSSCKVLVVDDGSTDDSKAVIASFGTDIDCLFKANGGQASSYNAGFFATQGDLVHFLDSDDTLEPSAIEEAVKVWKPGVSKVHFYLRVIEGANGTPTNILLPTTRLAEGDLGPHTLRYGHYSSPPATGNIYCRRSLAKILPMPEKDWVTSADTYPIFLSAFLGEVRSVQKPLGSYRIHGNNQDAQVIVNSDLLRYRLQKEIRRDAMLEEFCCRHALPYKTGSVSNHISHMKIRLASMVLDRDSHPLAEDRLSIVAWKTIMLALSEPATSVKKRCLIIGWVVSLLALPRRNMNRLVEWGFIPTKRPKFMNIRVKSQ